MFYAMAPMTGRAIGLLPTATGGFPVPGSISPAQFPPAVQESITRILAGPPKPAVTPEIMNRTQSSMIGPWRPWAM